MMCSGYQTLSAWATVKAVDCSLPVHSLRILVLDVLMCQLLLLRRGVYSYC